MEPAANVTCLTLLIHPPLQQELCMTTAVAMRGPRGEFPARPRATPQPRQRVALRPGRMLGNGQEDWDKR